MRKRRFQPLPVSPLPDEIVCRPFRTLRILPSYFDQPSIPAGVVVYVRRSGFRDAERSYWLEDCEGSYLCSITQERLERELEPCAIRRNLCSSSN